MNGKAGVASIDNAVTAVDNFSVEPNPCEQVTHKPKTNSTLKEECRLYSIDKIVFYELTRE